MAAGIPLQPAHLTCPLLAERPVRTRFIKNLSVGLDSGKVQSVNSAAPVRPQMIHRTALLFLDCPPSPEKTGRGELLPQVKVRNSDIPGVLGPA